MFLLIFCLGGILGSFVTLIIVLYWQSLVERIWLPPEKRHEPAKLIELDVLDSDNPKVWLGCLFQFLFAELKDTEKVHKWFREKLIIEVEELKEKLPSRFVKDIRLNKFGLGNQPPIISNVKLSGWKTNPSKDVVEEVAVRCDIRYAGEFYVALDLSLPIGQDAFVFIRLRQLVGNVEIRFSRQPFTHWSISFTDEPQTVIDAVTQVHGRAVPQLANIIVAKIKRTIRRRHVLPNFKIRFPPFFPKPLQQVVSSINPVPDVKKTDLQSMLPYALNVHLAAFSRLPPSIESAAVLFFTISCDSMPLPKQFSHVESFRVNILDPNEAIGILFFPSIYSVDAIDLVSRKFTMFQGYYISAVVADSPAQRAGIRPGGVLVAADGVTLASASSADAVLRKAATSCRNNTILLDIVVAESPPCQLVPFSDAMSPISTKDARFGSTGSINKSDAQSADNSSLDVDSIASSPLSPNATIRYRHRKNPSTASMVVDLNRTIPASTPLSMEEQPSSAAISRSSSDTNLAFRPDNTNLLKKATESVDIRPTTLYPIKPFPGNTPTVQTKDLNFLAEKPFQLAATLPPSVEDCVVLRYNDSVPAEDSDDAPEIIAGEVCWTKFKPYPTATGSSGNVNEVFTLPLPIAALNSLQSTEDVIRSVQKGSFLNVVAWIGVPNSESPLSTPNIVTKSSATSDQENREPFKWNRLHAISYAVVDLSTVVDELKISRSSTNSSTYVRRTASFYPFASIIPTITGDGNINDAKTSLPLSTQRGFAPELCFGDISIGFSLATDQQKQGPAKSLAPFPLHRQFAGRDSFAFLRADSRASSTATLRGIPAKLAQLRENCEHDLVVAVSSRSQPCTVCGKSLGILQRLSRSHAPLTCLRCGLLCHPRCAPSANKAKKTPSPLDDTTPTDSLDGAQQGATLASSASASVLTASSESSISASSQSSTGVMSKWKTRAKRIVAVAKEKEEKIVAKAAPRITQKWRDLKNRSVRPFHNVPSSSSLGSMPLEDGESVEIGEDVDTLSFLGVGMDNQNDTAVAEDLIRAWAAKAAESPGAALEGSLAEALLSNGESDALLFQLKNLGKELFADLDSEERRQRLDSVISRLTDQLDQESELHADLKTQLKVARSEEAAVANHNTGLIKKFKQNGASNSDSGPAGVAASCETALQRCDQRIRSLCLLIVHYSAGLDDCVSSAVRQSQNEISSSDVPLSDDSLRILASNNDINITELPGLLNSLN